MPDTIPETPTPGPWVLDPPFTIMGNDSRACGFMPIASVFSFVGTGGRAGNARLIAHAPDLHAAVRELLQLHIAHHNEPLHSAARAILRRIEGKDY